MEITYKNEPDHSYMIPAFKIPEKERYVLTMLEQHRMAGLLPLHFARLNGALRIRYEITRLQSMQTLFLTRSIGGQDMRGFLEGYLAAYESVDAYLLSAAELILSPECIYMDPGSYETYFAYLPGQKNGTINEAQALAEFFLRRLDAKDPEALSLGYGFYEKVCAENASIRQAAAELLADAEKAQEKAAPERVPEREKKEEEDISWLNGEVLPDFTAEDKDFLKEELPKKKRILPEGGVRRILIFGAALLGLLVLYGALVYFLEMDVTQMGGLAFLMMAVTWLVYGTWQGKKDKQTNHWKVAFKEADHEEAFIHQLMNEVSDETGQDLESMMLHEEEVWTKSTPNTNKPKKEQAALGETRVLAIDRDLPELTLVCEQMCYPSLHPLGRECLIGKQAERVDVVLPRHESVSRVHAKLEMTSEGMFLTDLGSTNGTFLNGEQLTGRQEIHAGDKVSFAHLSYRVRLGEKIK